MTSRDLVRKDISKVSKEERVRLRDAIIKLNQKYYPGKRDDPIVGGVSYWFKQDEIHQATHVHHGPAFLAWHRELCNRFELSLREIDSTISLHYWDWNKDPKDLFTQDFMGNSNGPAGEPWLSAGFYNPDAIRYRGDSPFELSHSNPLDPPKTLNREKQDGSPSFVYADEAILKAEDFPKMRRMLEGSHDIAHGYIGGTMGDPHTSFRDPFVFLLHSNVDRLFTKWQTSNGHPERLNPTTIYGAESDTVTTGLFPEAHIGILTPLEPWSGAYAPGVEEGLMEIRPWAKPENQEFVKDSKHPTVVSPPSYDDI